MSSKSVSQIFKGTFMEIGKALISHCLCISNVYWKFHISTIYSCAIIFPWNDSVTLKLWMRKFQCLLFVLKQSFISYYMTCMIRTWKCYFKLEIFVLHGVFLLICSTKSFFSNEKKISGNTEALFGKEALGIIVAKY